MTKYLFRYVSFETFVGMIQKKALTFVSPTLWDDPKESAPFTQFIEKIEDSTLKYMLMTVYYKTFCQSWSRVAESDAMWRIYAYGNRSVQIKASEEKLLQLPNVDLIPVVYSDRIKVEADGHKEALLRALSIKRRAFQHEKEVRLIKYYRFSSSEDAERHIKAFLALNQHPQMVEFTKALFPGLPLKDQIKNMFELVNMGKNRKSALDISFESIPEFIQGVKVHPLAPNWYVNIVQDYCKRNSLPFDGKSKLYSND